MRIGHVSMVAPNRCGLYEASRDMARSDILAGHEVVFVDVGIPNETERVTKDHRGDFNLVPCHSDLLDTCDIIMAHTGIPDLWLARNEVPVIWVLHGRPLACFRPNDGNSYTLLYHLSKWTRVKKMIYFWKEFKDYWENIIPSHKLSCIENPVGDESRFTPTGDFYKEMRVEGCHNFLIADSIREDICIFDILNGCIYASKHIKNIKFHFCGIDEYEKDKYQILLGTLQELGSLGSLHTRISHMEKAYRAVDCVITPQKIATRSVLEAKMCGCNIISDLNNRYSDIQFDVNKPHALLHAIKDEYINKSYVKNDCAKSFSAENYNKNINKIYKEVLNNG